MANHNAIQSVRTVSWLSPGYSLLERGMFEGDATAPAEPSACSLLQATLHDHSCFQREIPGRSGFKVMYVYPNPEYLFYSTFRGNSIFQGAANLPREPKK